MVEQGCPISLPADPANCGETAVLGGERIAPELRALKKNC